jgi:formate-dependent nitrite reductase membrane component NrfD
MMVLERAPYGRHVESRTPALPERAELLPARDWSGGEPGALVPYRGENYYGLPAVKASPYGWKIGTYFFTGGLAGSAQVLAVVADLVGGRCSVVRWGRYLALAGAAVSPVLLIADLHTPQRWYNMLRIFRKTSPMSIGSWTLTAFGTLSGLTALGQLAEDVTGSPRGRWLARLCGLPAGVAGALMSVYTGTLLAATSTPLWACLPRLVPALFGASAAATAAAAVSVAQELTGAPEGEKEAVGRFALAAGGAELALAAAADRGMHRQGLDEPLRRDPRVAALGVGAVGLGMVVPLVIHGWQALTGRRSRAASLLAAGSALAGGFLLRAAVLFAGNQSARRPEDYFRFTQPPPAAGENRLRNEEPGPMLQGGNPR